MNTEPGAWVLIYCYKTKKFLLGKRSHLVRKSGMWNFFGGHIDPGETPWTAAVRELKEETGFAVDESKIQPLENTNISELGFAFGLREFHYFVLFTEEERNPALGPEHSSSRWFAPAELPNTLNRPTMVAVEIGLVLKAQQLAEQLGLS